MPLPPASNDEPLKAPHHYLIAAGTARYDELPDEDQLPSVERDLELIEDLFVGQLGYERVLRELGRSPTSVQLRTGLEDWLKSDERRVDDVVVVYYSGHGFTPGDGLHYLCARDTEDERTAKAVATEEIARWLAESKIQHLLAIVDTCFSGQGITDLAAVAGRVWGRLGRDEAAGLGLFFIASARPRERAEARKSAFPEALKLAIADQRAARTVPRYLNLGAIVASVNAEFERRKLWQRARWTEAVSGGECQPLRNPRHPEEVPTGLDVETRDLLARNPDLLRHWGPRARGVEIEEQPGWYFTGRARVLRRLVAWLERPDDTQPRVVTGRPGSGKSAVLARLVTLSDPEYRQIVPLQDAPAGTVPPAGVVDVAVHARKKTLKDLTAALTAAAGVDDAGSTDVGTLVELLAGRKRPLVVVLDALDEAAEPRRICRDLLRPLVTGAQSGIRLLIGTRPELLRALGPDHVELDLDQLDPPEVIRADMREYVLRVLLAQGEPGKRTAYQEHLEIAEKVATAVAHQAFPTFLIARIASRTLAERGLVDLADEGWSTRLPSTVAAALDGDLSRFGPDAERIRDLLRPLAWSEGTGLPWKDVWAFLASVLAGGEPYDDRHIADLLARAGSYVIEGEEAGRSVYRIYHQALADHLREGDDAAAVQRRITETLLEIVPANSSGERDWDGAEPYVRTHIATHAAHARMLDSLLQDPSYLLAANPGPLLRSLPAALSDRGQRIARLFRRAVHHLRTAVPDERAAYLQLLARQSNENRLADRLAGQRTLPWSARWAHWRPSGEHRIVGRHASAVSSLATGMLDRRPVVVSGGLDAVVRVWDVTESVPVGTPEASPGGFITAVATVVLDGRPMVAFGSHDGRVRLRDLADGTLVWESPRRQSAISALAVGVFDEQVILASGDDRGTVRIWDLHNDVGLDVDPGHTDRILTVAVTSVEGAHRIISAGADGRIQVWGLSGAPFATRQVGEKDNVAVVTLDFSTTDPIALVADRTGSTSVWNIASGVEESGLFIGGGPLSMNVATIEGRKIVVTGGRDGLIRLNDLAGEDRVTRPLVGHVGAVRAVATEIIDDQFVVVSGGDDGTVRLWDLTPSIESERDTSTGAQDVAEWVTAAAPVDLMVVNGEPALLSIERGAPTVTEVTSGRVMPPSLSRELPVGVTAIAASQLRDRPVAVTCTIDGTIRVWDPAAGIQVRPPRSARQTWLASIATTSLNGRPVVAMTGANGRIEVWNLDIGRPIGRLPTPAEWFARVLTTGLTSKGPAMVAGGDDGSLIFADLATGVLRGPFPAHRGTVRALVTGMLAGVPVCISAGRDGVLWIWDLVEETPFPALLAQHNHASSLAIGLLAKGMAVISGGSDGTVRLWTPSGELLRSIDVGAVVSGITLPEANVIAVASPTGLILLDVAEPARDGVLSGYTTGKRRS